MLKGVNMKWNYVMDWQRAAAVALLLGVTACSSSDAPLVGDGTALVPGDKEELLAVPDGIRGNFVPHEGVYYLPDNVVAHGTATHDTLRFDKPVPPEVLLLEAGDYLISSFAQGAWRQILEIENAAESYTLKTRDADLLEIVASGSFEYRSEPQRMALAAERIELGQPSFEATGSAGSGAIPGHCTGDGVTQDVCTGTLDVGGVFDDSIIFSNSLVTMSYAESNLQNSTGTNWTPSVVMQIDVEDGVATESLVGSGWAEIDHILKFVLTGSTTLETSWEKPYLRSSTLNISTNENTVSCMEVLAPTDATTLETLYDSDRSYYGNMFEITPLKNINIRKFKNNFNESVGETATIAVYYKYGSYVGFEDNAAAWTKVGEGDATSAGLNQPTDLPFNIDVEATAGEKISFYLVRTDGGTNSYTYTGPGGADPGQTGAAAQALGELAEGDVAIENSDLKIHAGAAIGGLFGTSRTVNNAWPMFQSSGADGMYAPRVWNGFVDYVGRPVDQCTYTPIDAVPDNSLSSSINEATAISVTRDASVPSMSVNYGEVTAVFDGYSLYEPDEKMGGVSLPDFADFLNTNFADVGVTAIYDAGSCSQFVWTEGDPAITECADPRTLTIAVEGYGNLVFTVMGKEYTISPHLSIDLALATGNSGTYKGGFRSSGHVKAGYTCNSATGCTAVTNEMAGTDGCSTVVQPQVPKACDFATQDTVSEIVSGEPTVNLTHLTRFGFNLNDNATTSGNWWGGLVPILAIPARVTGLVAGQTLALAPLRSGSGSSGSTVSAAEALVVPLGIWHQLDVFTAMPYCEYEMSGVMTSYADRGAERVTTTEQTEFLAANGTHTNFGCGVANTDPTECIDCEEGEWECILAACGAGYDCLDSICVPVSNHSVTLTWNVAASDTAEAEEVDLDLYVKTDGGYVQTLYLDEWEQQGDLAYGNWDVDEPENTSVVQTINGGPTMLVSPVDFLNVVLEGKWSVNCGGDNDFMGFVFGFLGPISGNADDQDEYDTFVYQWKGQNQNLGGANADSGHYLAYVDGNIACPEGNVGGCYHSGTSDVAQAFWGQQSLGGKYNLLASDTAGSNGWLDGNACGRDVPFVLTYTYNQIKVEVDGATVFDISPTDVPGMSTFPAGRFGFYNYSQNGVTYKDFTAAAAPGAPTDLNLFRPDVCSVFRPVTDTCENVVNNDGVLNAGLGGACANPINPGVAVTVPSTTIAGICPAGEASTTGTCSGSSTTLVSCSGLSPCPAGCGQLLEALPDRLGGGLALPQSSRCWGRYSVVEDCAYTTEMGCSAVAACAWAESGVCNSGLVMCSTQTKGNCEALQTVGLCQWNSDDLKNDPPFVEHAIITTNTSGSYEAWVVVEEGAAGVSEPLPFRLRFRIPNNGDEIRTHEILGEVNPGVRSQSISVTWEGDLMTTSGWSKVYTDSGTTP
jgi:hypothetical protein